MEFVWFLIGIIVGMVVLYIYNLRKALKDAQKVQKAKEVDKKPVNDKAKAGKVK